MKEPVICFAVGNADYLDPIIVATNSFAEYNPDIPLVVFLNDGSAKIFQDKIKLPNVTFRNCHNEQVIEFCKKHHDDFSPEAYAFSIDKMVDLFAANYVLDVMVDEYRDKYEVLIRLDMDVIFVNSILPSVEKFITSNYRIGGIPESQACCLYSPNKNYQRIYVAAYLNAGSLMFRLDDQTINDHLQRSIDIIEHNDFRHFHYPDQDALNNIYANTKSYDVTADGWWIPMCNMGKTSTNMIFIHYASTTKPFNYTDSNKLDHIFRDSYPYYLQQAKKYKCSDEFIHKLTTVIDMLRRDQVVIGIDVLRLKFKVAFDVLMKNRGTS